MDFEQELKSRLRHTLGLYLNSTGNQDVDREELILMLKEIINRVCQIVRNKDT